jgi:histidine triad (HIT) family protein
MERDFYCDKLLAGEVEIQKVVETENMLAFHHTSPSWPVHIMVVPKQHLDSIAALSGGNESLLLEMFSVINQVIAEVVREHGGCRVTTNVGSCQTERHLHWHIYVGDRMM